MPLDERDEARLRDMLSYSQEATVILGSMTLSEMEAHTMARLAVTRRIEVIGEAGHQVSAPVRMTYAVPISGNVIGAYTTRRALAGTSRMASDKSDLFGDGE
jgi:hypothetical protein